MDRISAESLQMSPEESITLKLAVNVINDGGIGGVTLCVMYLNVTCSYPLICFLFADNPSRRQWSRKNIIISTVWSGKIPRRIFCCHSRNWFHGRPKLLLPGGNDFLKCLSLLISSSYLDPFHLPLLLWQFLPNLFINTIYSFVTFISFRIDIPITA